MRRVLDVLVIAILVSAALVAVGALFSGSWRTWAIAIMVLAFAVLLHIWPRRVLAHGRVELAVTIMALGSSVLILGGASQSVQRAQRRDRALDPDHGGRAVP
ncbi:MAG: hypothetical protein M3Q31_19640 [Actinomycetota bacterium]|nr:hypothetical protein [Actinomycetota bacterium]